MVRDKTQKMMQQNSCITQPKNIHSVPNTYSWNFARDYKMSPPHFLDDELGKNVVLHSGKYGI
jgi:hypothetical protein